MQRHKQTGKNRRKCISEENRSGVNQRACSSDVGSFVVVLRNFRNNGIVRNRVNRVSQPEKHRHGGIEDEFYNIAVGRKRKKSRHEGDADRKSRPEHKLAFIRTLFVGEMSDNRIGHGIPDNGNQADRTGKTGRHVRNIRQEEKIIGIVHIVKQGFGGDSAAIADLLPFCQFTFVHYLPLPLKFFTLLSDCGLNNG